MRLAWVALQAACLAAVAVLPSARAHGYMRVPQSRNYRFWSDYCPQCLAAGGPYAVSNGSTLVWPDGLHGICGDPYNGERKHEAGGVYSGVNRDGVIPSPDNTYEEGSVLNVSITVTAFHKGEFEFRICRVAAPADPGQSWADAERAQLTEECLYQQQLVQADVAGAQAPYQKWWYMGQVPGWVNGRPLDPINGVPGPWTDYNSSWQLPMGLTCDGVSARCVMQWHWVTGNSCEPPNTPANYSSTVLPACGAAGPYPEEFWNCADLLIYPQGMMPSPVPPSPPLPVASPPPTGSPNPTPSPGKPVPTGDYPCQSGDAQCFCSWKGSVGIYADVKDGCKSFYTCTDAVIQSAHQPCQAGLLFDETISACNWDYLVTCASQSNATLPSPVQQQPPAPSPSPKVASPSPSPLPSPQQPSPVPSPKVASPPPSPTQPSPSSSPKIASPSPSPKQPSPSPSPKTASPSPSPKVASPSPSPKVASPSPSPKRSPPPPRRPPPPSPLPRASPQPGGAYPCVSGDAQCFCSWKRAVGYFADVKAGCKSFYICTTAMSQSVQQPCQAGLLFDDTIKACNWDYLVTCPTP